MNEQEIQELRDIQGFIDWCIETDQGQGYCLANIGHDCGLLLRHASDGSSPRTSGYAKLAHEANIWTIFRISDDGNGVRVEFETNDDNDDGYPDPEVVRATYDFKSVESALSITGKTRIGLYGQPVNVYLNGKLV